jgi:tRNA 2-thiouridine synthesizing protein D
MKFTVQINTGPFTQQASDTAYQFTRAALEAGHEIHRVFFYHDGVNNATMYSVPPQDDRNLQQLWSALGARYDLDIIVCVAAAQRRGIMDESEAKKHSKGHANIAAGFQISGLGQLIEAGVQSDRLLVFGD